jgi:hypothetical protein
LVPCDRATVGIPRDLARDLIVSEPSPLLVPSRIRSGGFLASIIESKELHTANNTSKLGETCKYAIKKPFYRSFLLMYRMNCYTKIATPGPICSDI